MLALLLAAPAAMAGSLRLATWNGDFSRKGPGLLLRDLERGEDVALQAALDDIAEVRADVLLLTRFDYDAGLTALGALRDALGRRGLDYPHLLSLRPNTGMTTGRDLDGDGRRGGPRDAQGYGRFAGDGGLALLSRLPLGKVTDLSGLLWNAVPGSKIAPDDPGYDIQRLSSTNHWIVPLGTGATPLTLLAFAATPPVFDGPEDRNGRRNSDELALWSSLLDGKLDIAAPAHPVVIGNANLDPARGDGLKPAIGALLDDPRLQDPLPGTATVAWDSTGPMRVSYILPPSDVTVTDAGVRRPVDGAGPHRLVWVDLALPD